MSRWLSWRAPTSYSIKITNVGFWQIVLQKCGGCSSPGADEVIE